MTKRGIYVIPDRRTKSGIRYVGLSDNIDARFETRTDGRARKDGELLRFAVNQTIRRDVEARLIRSLNPGGTKANIKDEPRDRSLSLSERASSWAKAREIKRKVEWRLR